MYTWKKKEEQTERPSQTTTSPWGRRYQLGLVSSVDLKSNSDQQSIWPSEISQYSIRHKRVLCPAKGFSFFLCLGQIHLQNQNLCETLWNQNEINEKYIATVQALHLRQFDRAIDPQSKFDLPYSENDWLEEGKHFKMEQNCQTRLNRRAETGVSAEQNGSFQTRIGVFSIFLTNQQKAFPHWTVKKHLPQ